MGDLKLGYNTGYWSAGPPEGVLEVIRDADSLGLDSIWAAEAYGSDVLTPLAWWGSQTEKVKLGTGILQMSARQPTAAAMAAMTLDHLSGGRVILGIGVSGPQVVEGWYGMPFEKPLARTREYVAILRDVWAREGPVTADGPFYPLPLPDGHRPRQAAEVVDPPAALRHPGLPRRRGAEEHRPRRRDLRRLDGDAALARSTSSPTRRRSPRASPARAPATRAEDFEVAATVPMLVSDDVEAAADMLRHYYALYFGGMGAKGKNFHANVPIRMGYGDMVETVQDLYLAGKKQEAAEAIPFELIDQMSLIGPPDKIRHDLEAWRDSFVTTLLIGGDAATVRTAAELVLG